jgi:hypothetical protein
MLALVPDWLLAASDSCWWYVVGWVRWVGSQWHTRVTDGAVDCEYTPGVYHPTKGTINMGILNYNCGRPVL